MLNDVDAFAFVMFFHRCWCHWEYPG